jgi:hypothetical protein
MVDMHDSDELGRWRSLFDERAAVSLAGVDTGYAIACAASHYGSGTRYRYGLDTRRSAK